MSPEEDNATTKLKHMIYVLTYNQSLNYIFYLEFLVHISTVKEDIAYEEMLFCSLHGKLCGRTA